MAGDRIDDERSARRARRAVHAGATRRGAALALVALAAIGCAPRPRTEVLVRIDAEPEVRAAMRHVRVRVLGGGASLVERVDAELPAGGEPLVLPITVAVIPEGGARDRRFRVEATALDDAREPITTVRALSSFVHERTMVLDLLLEDCCRAIACGAEETCRACACAPELVDPDTLRPHHPDAGAARDGGADAGSLDAGADAAVHAGIDAGPRTVDLGDECDLLGAPRVCPAGAACTCTGTGGCAASAEPARCWAMADIGCGRPIDLSARFLAASVHTGGSFTYAGDFTGAPDVTTNSCGGGGGRPDVWYVINLGALQDELPSDVSIGARTSHPMEYWYGCASPATYGTCGNDWSLWVSGRESTSLVHFLVEGSGSPSDDAHFITLDGR